MSHIAFLAMWIEYRKAQRTAAKETFRKKIKVKRANAMYIIFLLLLCTLHKYK